VKERAPSRDSVRRSEALGQADDDAGGGPDRYQHPGKRNENRLLASHREVLEYQLAGARRQNVGQEPGKLPGDEFGLEVHQDGGYGREQGKKAVSPE